MPYPVENALFQWREGERRVRDTDEPARFQLERAADAVLEELRRRLGSSFSVEELADFYAGGTDWADEIAQRWASGTDTTWVVDSAFHRYAREATNYAGGRAREEIKRPDSGPATAGDRPARRS
ncbi:MAG TPA: hypothetical protein VF752_04790 [Thermoleophilaceae bacterium]